MLMCTIIVCWEERKEMVDIQSITNTPGSVRVSIKQYFIDKCLLWWGTDTDVCSEDSIHGSCII